MSKNDGLKEERKKRIENVKKLLKGNDYIQAKDNLDWIAASFEIERYSKKRNPFFWPVIITFLSLFIIGIGVSLKIKTANIALNILCSTVNFQLAKNYDFSTSGNITDLFISDITEINKPGLFRKSNDPFTLTIQGRGIGMSKISMPAGTGITLNQDKNRLSVLFKIFHFNTTIFTNDARLLIENQLPDVIKSGSSEPIDVKLDSLNHSNNIPVKLTIADTSGWKMKDLLIGDLSFNEYQMDTILINTSGILSGKITLLETGQERSLSEGDWVTIEGLTSTKVQLFKDQGRIRIIFEGRVSNLFSGSSRDFTTSMKPSWIEYLYYSRFIAIIWCAIAFVWGLLWSIRKSMFTSIN